MKTDCPTHFDVSAKSDTKSTSSSNLRILWTSQYIFVAFNEDVLKYVTQMKSKAERSDQIGIEILIVCFTHCQNALSHTINTSIFTDDFPQT